MAVVKDSGTVGGNQNKGTPHPTKNYGSANAGVNRSAYGSVTAKDKNMGGSSGAMDAKRSGSLNTVWTGNEFGKTTPITQSYANDPERQAKLNNLEIAYNDPDRNFHFYTPNEGADENYLQRAMEINQDRSIYMYNQYWALRNNGFDTLEDSDQWIRDAQIYYQWAKDNDFKVVVDDKEVSMADLWKDVYDDADYNVNFGYYLNGNASYRSLEQSQAKLQDAQARLDAAETDDDKKQWSTIVSALTDSINIENRKRRKDLLTEKADLEEQLTNTKDLQKSQWGMAGLGSISPIAKKDQVTRKDIANLEAKIKEVEAQVSSLDSDYDAMNLTPEMQEMFKRVEKGRKGWNDPYWELAQEALANDGYAFGLDVDAKAEEIYQDELAQKEAYLNATGRQMSYDNLVAQANAFNTAKIKQAEASGEAAGSMVLRAIRQGMTEGWSDTERVGPAGGTTFTPIMGDSPEYKQAKDELDDLIAEKNQIINRQGSNPQKGDATRLQELIKEIATAQQKVKEIEESGNAEENKSAKAGEFIGAVGDKIKEHAIELNEDSRELMSNLEASVSKSGKYGVRIASQVFDIGLDAASGLGLINMGIRVAGQSSLEAIERGADIEEEALFAAYNVMVETLTEKLGGTFEDVYGTTATSSLIEKAIERIATTRAGENGLRVLASVGGEQLEELLSGLADPVGEWIIDEEKRNKHIYEINPDEIVESMLIAGIVALGGAGVEAGQGGYSAKNNQIEAQDIAKVQKAATVAGPPTKAEAKRLERAESRLAPEGTLSVDSQGRVIVTNKNGVEGYIERHQQSTAFEEQRKQAERTAEFLRKQQEQREAMEGSEEELDTDATIEEQEAEPEEVEEELPAEQETESEENDRPSLDELRAELAEQESARKTVGENRAEQQAPEGKKTEQAPTASETATEAQEGQENTQTPESTQKSVKPAEERAEKKAPKNPDKAAAWKKAEAERTARNNALRADIKKRVSQVADEDVTVSGTYNGSSVTAVYDGKTIQLTNSQGQQLTPITPKNRKDARKILYNIAKETRGTVESTTEVEAEQSPVETTAPAEIETAKTEEATNPEVQQPAEVETKEAPAPAEEAETKMEAPTQEVETEAKTEPAVEEAPAVTTESVADGVKSGTITPAELRQALKSPDVDVAEIRKALGMRAVNAENSLRTANTIGNMVRRYQANLAKMKSADTLTEAEKKAVEGEEKQKQKNDIQNAKEKAIRNQSIEEQLKGEELSDSLRENDESANQSGREDGNDAEPVSDISGGNVGGGLDVRSTKPGGKRKTGNAGSGVLVEPTDSRKYGSVEREIAEAYKEKNLTLDQKQQIEGSRDAWNEEYKKANVPIMASKNVSKTYKKLLAVANKYGRKFLTIRDAANARISRAESGRCLTLTSIIGPTLITHRYFPPSARRHILNLDGQSAIHEYSHDFGTVYAEEHDGNRPDYSEGLKAVTQSLVDSGLILDKDQAKIRNQLIHLYFNKVGVNSTIGTLFARKYKGSPEWKKAENAAKLQQEKSEYAKKTGKEKAEYLKTNYSTDYKEMLKTVREEIMMELVSEGSYFREVLKAKGQDISNYSKPARAWMEKDGGVPAGFYDEIAPIAAELDKENLAWLEEQDKIRNDDGTFIESASTNLDTVNEEIDLSSNQESIEDYFDYPEGATSIRQNKGIAELRSQGERIHADDVEYQSVGHQAIIDAANKTINSLLNSGKYSAQDIANWFNNRSPRNADRFIMQLGKEMFYRLQQQRVSLETSGGKAVSDARITTDINQLRTLEESFGEWVTNAVGNAGEILGQHADLSPVVATKNNAKNSFLGNIKPGEIDPDSEGAKMYRIVDDHVSYQESINARKEAGKITEAEAAQLFANEITELSKIRNVRGTFGNSGKLMDAWEKNMINFILKHDKHAYDTLRMLALGSTNRISSDFNNVGTVDTIKQVRYLFLLSNFATKVNNVLNNLESSTTGALGQNIAVAATGKRAAKLMGEQTMTYNSNWGRLFPRGVNKELNEYMLTKGAESVLSLYYGLEVDEGIIDMDTGGRYNQNSGTAGRLLARAQFLSGLGMQTTDAMAIARSYKGQEINIDKMNVSEARKQVLKKQAMENARAQMYHAESKAAKLMNNARDALNNVRTFGNDVTGKIGLGDILMPFVQVPTNVAMRAMRATPAGVFYSFGKYFRGMRALEVRKAQVQQADKLKLMRENGVALTVDQQNYLQKYGNLKMPTDAEVVALQRSFGEGASNAAITLVGAVLAGMGGIRDFDDEDDKDLQRLAKERGFTGLQINLSHPFKKDNQDWDYDNDLIIGGSWLEVAALPICAGYALYHSAIEDGGDFASTLQSVMTSPLRSINTIVDVAQEIPGMQQIGKIWDAYENLQYEKDLSKKGDKIVAGLSQYAANTLSTFVIPNQVAQFAAGIDNTVRDVYSADTNWEVAKNIFQNKVPFWRNKLPEKQSSLGEKRTYGSNTMWGLANRMIIPGTGIQVWKKSELERYFEKMSKAGYGNMLVENSAPKSIKAEGQTFDLNSEERRKFDSMRDSETRIAQEALLHSEGFLSLSEELQQDAMQDIRALVNRLTEQDALINKKDCTANVDFDKWEEAYMSKYADAAQFLTAKYGAKEFFKNNQLLDAKAADAYLKNTYSKLDDTARELLDNSYAHLDSMYDAYSSTGMTSEQYWRVEALRKKYAELQKSDDNEETASALQRNLIVEYENMTDLTPEQKSWAEENKKLWLNIPASTETIDKIRKVTGLTAKEADDWLDLKSNTAPLGGYKKLSQNQRLMMVRDSNYSEDKKWKLIEYEASDSAWAKLVKFRDEGKTVAEALSEARWYKPTKFTRWIEQRYDVIYDQAPDEEEED